MGNIAVCNYTIEFTLSAYAIFSMGIIAVEEIYDCIGNNCFMLSNSVAHIRLKYKDKPSQWYLVLGE